MPATLESDGKTINMEENGCGNDGASGGRLIGEQLPAPGISFSDYDSRMFEIVFNSFGYCDIVFVSADSSLRVI